MYKLSIIAKHLVVKCEREDISIKYIVLAKHILGLDCFD